MSSKSIIRTVLYLVTLIGFLLMYFQQPEIIEIPRTEAFIALIGFAGYLFINGVSERLSTSISEFKSELISRLSSIEKNLPMKSNPGRYRPPQIPPKRRQPGPSGGSALGGLVLGGVFGALVGGGPGAVIGGLIGAILGDQIERGAHRRRPPRP